LFKIVKLLW